MLLTSAAAFCAHSYDILIVGGGTAGLALAARLSAAPLRVGVLEAGHARASEPAVYLPGVFGRAVGNASFDWAFVSAPQRHLAGKVMPYSRGKMLGGTSGLNAMCWTQPARRDYDIWAELLADEGAGWGWDGMLAARMSAETVQMPETAEQRAALPEPPFEPDVHGTEGPVRTSFSKYVPGKLAGALVGAMEALGVRRNPEPYGGDNIGAWVGLSSVDQSTARRSSSDTAYLLPVAEKDNLVVLTGAHATRILLKDKEAVGVEFVDEAGGTYQAFSDKEVVLSAGCIQSPQLLELSGIGDPKVLEAAGVEVQVELPAVGDALEDHWFFPMTFELVPGIPTMADLEDPDFFANVLAEYTANKTGFLSGASVHDYGFLPMNFFMDADDIVALKEQAPTNTPLDRILRDHLDSDQIAHMEISAVSMTWSQTAPIEDRKRYLTLAGILLHPFSRGTVHIESSDPFQPPRIDPNGFSQQIDAKILVEIAKFVEKVARTSPLKDIIVQRVEPADDAVLTDEEWWEFIALTGGSVYHPVGTVKMGAEGAGAVDAKLKVRGVERLRVVDNSVVPAIPSSHTQSVAYSIAEKAAAMILEEWIPAGARGGEQRKPVGHRQDEL